jgi:hypothetical protein
MPNEFIARNGVIALNNSTVTGSLNVTAGITGSLLGTASYATQALTASNANTASYIITANTASYVLQAVSSSYSLTASNAQGGTTNYITLWSGTTILSSSTIYQTGGNVGIGTSTATPAARLQVSGTVNVVNFRGSGSLTTSSIFTVDGAAGRLFSVNDSLSGSLFSVNTIAGLPIVEAFSDNTVRIGKYGVKALYVSQSNVGVGKETALNGNLDISGSMYLTGSLNVLGGVTSTGTITAQTLVVQTITSSIDYVTGSTRFGSNISDTHVFTGSISVSGSITGTPGVTNTLTSSFAISASWAPSVGGFTLIDTQIYSGSTTWTKPLGAELVIVLAIGPGGGGAGGGAAANTAYGGTGGGSAGSSVRQIFPATILGPTEDIIVGATGSGGASVTFTAAGSNGGVVGNPGGTGGDVKFGTWLTAEGGNGGTINTVNNALAGGGPAIAIIAGYTIPIEVGGAGTDASATDNVPAATTPSSASVFMSSGGGAGGSVGVSTGAINGTTGATAGSIAGGTAGTGASATLTSTTGTAGGNGSNNAAETQGSGGGGGGNAVTSWANASSRANGGAGGNGGIGAGGGGGGAARTATTAGAISTSGKGGNGGPGRVIVYTYGTS